MFGRLEDWRGVATHYDRCPVGVFSAITRAATIVFWWWSTSPDPRRFERDVVASAYIFRGRQPRNLDFPTK